MPTLYDSRSNEIQIAFPDNVTNGVVPDARPVNAILGALNAEVLMDLNGAQVAMFDCRTAAGALTIVFEGTVDGTNYFALPAWVNNQLLVAVAQSEVYVASVVVATTTSGFYTIGVSGLRRVRCRVSAYTSGNITVAARASIADNIIVAKPFFTTLHVTATAAVNVASTATLPLVAGMFHYITRIRLVKLYAVVGIAAGTGTIITTTNMPGAIAWTTEQNARAAGEAITVIDENYCGNPIRSSVIGTATTFVAPLQLQTIWRWNVSYYLGF